MTRIFGLRPAVPALIVTLVLAGCETAPQVRAPIIVTPTVVPEDKPVSPAVLAAAEKLTQMAAMQDRLYKVAAPLLIQNADLCKGQARNLLGFTARNRYWYPGDYNEASHVAFGMGERLQVTGVLAGSGAAKAGLRRGDGLVAAGGKQLPTGPDASSKAGAVFGPLVKEQANLAMTIERDDKERQLTVPVTRACGFAIELGNSDNVNSYADGQRVLVTRGMVHFAQSDQELAVVLAKGMAHNVLGHHNSQRMASTLDTMIDNLIKVKPDTSLLIGSGGVKAMPAEVDAAADELSLYMLARAGYSIDAATPFWKRLASTYPATVLNGYVANHPGTSARLSAIQTTVAEIKSKQASKKALVP